MAKRFLTWHLSTPLQVGASQREAYEVEENYRPVRVWMRVSRTPSPGNVVIDINDDDVSIFTSPKPGIQTKSLLGERDYFVEPRLIEKKSVITLDVDQIGAGEGGENLTVQLELEQV